MQYVLRTIPSYFPHVSGPANQARAISCGLAPLGFVSNIVTTNFGAPDAAASDVIDGVRVLRAPVRTGVMQYHVAPQAWPLLRTLPADLIHVHSYRNFLADAAAWAAHTRSLPLVLHLHGTLVGYQAIVGRSKWWLYNTYDAVSRPLALLRRAHVVVSTSEEADETARYGIARERIHIIPMGIDPSQYRFPDVERDPQRVCFVGRLTEDRNPELLLRALATIKHLPWTCRVVGGEIRRSYATALGYAAYLQTLVRELGIAERVTFTGQLHGEALRREYAAAGVFAYPSHYENFGQTILEAAAAGCALLATPVGVAHDLIVEGVTGFFIGDRAPEALAQRLAWLLEHPDEQRAIGEAARRRTTNAYAWQPILQRYAELYQTAIRQHHDSSRKLHRRAHP